MFHHTDYATTDSTISSEESLPVVPNRTTYKTATISEIIGGDAPVDLAFRLGNAEFWVLGTPKSLQPDIEKIAHRLVELSQLRENWDSYEGQPISPESFKNGFLISMEFLNLHELRPFIGPLSNGGLVLDWDVDEGEIEVEVHNDRASLCLPNCNGDDQELPDGSITRAKMLLHDWLRTR